MQFATAFEAQLATGQPHDLPALQAPKQPPINPSLSPPEVYPSQNPPRALRRQALASSCEAWSCTNRVLSSSREVISVLG